MEDPVQELSPQIGQELGFGIELRVAQVSVNVNRIQNNIAFNNGGSCLRVTKSAGTHFVNNTCMNNCADSSYMDFGQTAERPRYGCL